MHDFTSSLTQRLLGDDEGARIPGARRWPLDSSLIYDIVSQTEKLLHHLVCFAPQTIMIDDVRDELLASLDLRRSLLSQTEVDIQHN